jgi:hypothetical protein
VVSSSDDEVDGQLCVRLDLEARRPSLSYRKAQLWVTPQGTPLKAEFLLASGKFAKRVLFEAAVPAAGAMVLPGMALQELGGATAHVRFSAWKPGKHDPALFALPEGGQATQSK